MATLKVKPWEQMMGMTQVTDRRRMPQQQPRKQGREQSVDVPCLLFVSLEGDSKGMQ